jgi:hypothetical protein
MNCAEAQAQLETGTARPGAPSAELLAHLQECAECRAGAEQLRLVRLLRTLPVPPPSAGFVDRALQQSWPQQSVVAPRRPLSGAALAAGVVLAVLIAGKLALPYFGAGGDDAAVQVVQMLPQEMRPIEVLMVSQEALPNATITVHLDKNLSLAGYPGVDTLSWQAPLQAGNNKLTLPVQLQGAPKGAIVIEIESGTARKQLRVSVEAPEPKTGTRLMI